VGANVATTNKYRGSEELSLPGAKVPGSESSLERKFLELSLCVNVAVEIWLLLGVNVATTNEYRGSEELSLPGAKVPGNESSQERNYD